MRSKNRYFPVIAAVVVLLITAVFGYSGSDEKKEMPVRILFNNNGGKVVFSHLVHHRDYQIACAECHHDRAGQKFQINAPDKNKSPQGQDQGRGQLACGTCHPVEFNEDFVERHIDSFPDESYCVRCHHTEFGKVDFDHDEHISYADDDCWSCHHGKDIEPEPQKCSNCHKEKEENGIPGMREAAHESCANCHDDMFDKGLSSCNDCHIPVDMNSWSGDFSSCGDCHDKKVRDLVVPRMNAFHEQCMSCHRRLKKGPYKENDCSKCHIK